MKTIVSFTLDKQQYDNVLDLCDKFEMNLSQILRLAFKNALHFEGDKNLSTYKSIKKGVRLSENDIRMLAFVMRTFDVKSISEACRISLLLLVNQYSKDFSLNN